MLLNLIVSILIYFSLFWWEKNFSIVSRLAISRPRSENPRWRIQWQVWNSVKEDSIKDLTKGYQSAPGIYSSGFPPYLEFCHLLENAWNFKKWEKTWHTQIWEKLEICKFSFSLFKTSFTKHFIHIFVIYTLSTQTLWYEAKLTLDSIAFTWK